VDHEPGAGRRWHRARSAYEAGYAWKNQGLEKLRGTSFDLMPGGVVSVSNSCRGGLEGTIRVAIWRHERAAARYCHMDVYKILHTIYLHLHSIIDVYWHDIIYLQWDSTINL